MHYGHLAGKEGADCFAFHWLVTCLLSVAFCLLLGVVDRLCSVIVALPGHLYYFDEVLFCFLA